MPTLEEHPDTWHHARDEDFLAFTGKIPGFFPVDKPAGRTSRQVVDGVRKKLGVKKAQNAGLRAGHTGTLDPFATGVLVIAVDRALKVLKYTENWDKVYDGVILLGIETDSYDVTGSVLKEFNVPELTKEEVETTLNRFVGEIIQKTPPVSAAKVRGKRLYERARQGERLSPPRVVDVHSIDITEFALPKIHVRVHCGRGTYIRSIAHELGEALGTGAVLESLRRTKEGPFSISDCIDLDLG